MSTVRFVGGNCRERLRKRGDSEKIIFYWRDGGAMSLVRHCGRSKYRGVRKRTRTTQAQRDARFTSTAFL